MEVHDDGKIKASTKSGYTAVKDMTIPPALRSALDRNAKAAAAFETLSPSHRKEYIQWIAEAKRDDTRERRAATAIEWLEKGKPRNEK